MKIFDAALEAIQAHRVYFSFTEQRWLCPQCPKWSGADHHGADLHVAEAVDKLAS